MPQRRKKSGPRASKKESKSTLSVVAINLAVLLVGLLIVEGVVAMLYGRDRLVELNLNVLKNCKYHFEVGNLYGTGPRSIVYTKDRYGFRGSYRSLSDIDIFTVGGSTTDLRYIDDDETWQAVIQKRFKADAKDVSVVSGGVDGQSTVGHIKNFELWYPKVPGFKPKHFLLNVGINDYFIPDGGYHDGLAETAPQAKGLLSQLCQNSYVCYFLRVLVGTYETYHVRQIGHGRVDFSRLKWTTQPALPVGTDYGKVLGPRLTSYEARLRKLNELIRAFGAQPIFVTQAKRNYRKLVTGIEGVDELFQYYDGYAVNGVDEYHMMGLVNEATLRVCRDVQGVCVDAAQAVSYEDSDFYDRVHSTPQGAKKIGDAIYEQVKALY